MNLVSQTYKSVLKETHSRLNDTWGGGHSVDKLPKYEADMKAKEVNTILDYGCANGKFKVYMNTHKPDYDVREYGFFNISTKDAITLLSDGSNAHKIVKDGQWWIDLFSTHFDLSNVEIGRIETNFRASTKSAK
jgi:hypothetical protein